ncbi:hypothetical protein EON65_51995, partial [archaeon]
MRLLSGLFTACVVVLIVAGAVDAVRPSNFSMYLEQLENYQTLLFTQVGNIELKRAYRKCYIDKMDGLIAEWGDKALYHSLDHRKAIQEILAAPCLNENNEKQSLFRILQHIRDGNDNKTLPYPVLGNVKPTDKEDKIVPASYYDMMANELWFSQAAPRKPQCQYSVTVSNSTVSGYDMIVQISQYDCPENIVLHRGPSADFRLLSTDSDKHVVCTAIDLDYPVDLSPGNVTYTFGCSVLID